MYSCTAAHSLLGSSTWVAPCHIRYQGPSTWVVPCHIRYQGPSTLTPVCTFITRALPPPVGTPVTHHIHYQSSSTWTPVHTFITGALPPPVGTPVTHHIHYQSPSTLTSTPHQTHYQGTHPWTPIIYHIHHKSKYVNKDRMLKTTLYYMYIQIVYICITTFFQSPLRNREHGERLLENVATNDYQVSRCGLGPFLKIRLPN